MAVQDSAREQLAEAEDVARFMKKTVAALAQDRRRGVGPKYIKAGRRVYYRWSDVEEFLDQATSA